ncbi:MAG: hypothetical protein GY861_27035 [bacterium]|nr:hypothetical protein [bacterium]
MNKLGIRYILKLYRTYWKKTGNRPVTIQVSAYNYRVTPAAKILSKLLKVKIDIVG